MLMVKFLGFNGGVSRQAMGDYLPTGLEFDAHRGDRKLK